MVKGSCHKPSSLEKIRSAIYNRSPYVWQFVYDNGENHNVVFSDNLSTWAAAQSLSKGSLHQVSDKRYKRKSYKNWTVKKYNLSLLSDSAVKVIEAALSRFQQYGNVNDKFRKYWPKKEPVWKKDLTEKYEAHVEYSIMEQRKIQKQLEIEKEEQLFARAKAQLSPEAFEAWVDQYNGNY